MFITKLLYHIYAHIESPPPLLVESGAKMYVWKGSPGNKKTLLSKPESSVFSAASRGYGANDEARTRYLHLGKVALYQMSYVRIRLRELLYRREEGLVKGFLKIFSPAGAHPGAGCFHVQAMV